MLALVHATMVAVTNGCAFDGYSIDGYTTANGYINDGYTVDGFIVVACWNAGRYNRCWRLDRRWLHYSCTVGGYSFDGYIS